MPNNDDLRGKTGPLTLQILAVALVAGLTFPPLSAYTSVYMVLCTSLFGLVLLSRYHLHVFGLFPFKLVWAAFALLTPTVLLAFNSINDLNLIIALAPIPLATGLVLLLHENTKFAAAGGIALLCLIGAIGAFFIALNDIYVFHVPRAGGGNNPIHFGGLSLIIGFSALIGLFGSRSAWRFIFILGPILGWTAAVFSGSRGPMLAGLVLTLIASPFLIRWFWREKSFRVIMALTLVLVVALFSLGGGWQLQRAKSMLETFSSLATDSTAVDGSTNARLVLYSSAWEAFKESPIFGHGFGSFAQVAGKHMPDKYAGMRNSEHLHSDIADFAAIGGVFGLATYFCLLAAPLFAFRGVKNVEVRRAVMLGGIILSVGYFSLGLTNAMFGILPQTTLYGVLLGVLVGMAQTADS